MSKKIGMKTGHVSFIRGKRLCCRLKCISLALERKDPRAHADYINVEAFLSFKKDKGSVPQIDCMIEAKMKDESLFQLMRDLSEQVDVEIIDGASFYIK